MDILQNAWQGLTKILKQIIEWAVMLLPDSPFKVIDTSVVADYLPYFNWVFPVAEIIATMQVWLSAISIFYIYQAYLRFVKAIE
ncbi:hypothetical protein RBG61_01385 [Paludicola sp. MB14-C6]|uniref:hypothetical protein n=1 Tax=Paludihabitans sp. MB14-C6 TaxID=3070656 RepID=UPI0027DBDD30|nr:hypothetical protein [Paludicola sp. MB14-C6]WMJ23342.1 hypothetical protein RBG61_01385 [Paludicola sp. MB14-C6]